MSDFTISVVPAVTTYPDRHIKAAEIVAWLSGVGIIKTSTQSGNKPYITLGAQAASAVLAPELLPVQINPNELEIETQRSVFASELEALICPTCQEDISADDWDLTPWFEQQSEGLLCPHCRQEADIQRYIFHPAWGFSNLGFTFWNWPDFKPEFVQQFAQKLGCAIRIVRARI